MYFFYKDNFNDIYIMCKEFNQQVQEKIILSFFL